MKEQALNLVEELNDELQDRGGLEYYYPFEFKSYGWNNSAIYFMGIVLWTEDNDEREYLTESDGKESLRIYVIREAEKILKDLNLKMDAF
jgi:hypothetical protein